MHAESVEIYSDKTNGAIMRHPGRRFPGILIQGDTLYSLCLSADEVCSLIGRESPGFDEANRLRNALWSKLSHDRAVLDEHKLPLPFSEQPTFKYMESWWIQHLGCGGGAGILGALESFRAANSLPDA
jgi:hypothetical protein